MSAGPSTSTSTSSSSMKPSFLVGLYEVVPQDFFKLFCHEVEGEVGSTSSTSKRKLAEIQDFVDYTNKEPRPSSFLATPFQLDDGKTTATVPDQVKHGKRVLAPKMNEQLVSLVKIHCQYDDNPSTHLYSLDIRVADCEFEHFDVATYRRVFQYYDMLACKSVFCTLLYVIERKYVFADNVWLDMLVNAVPYLDEGERKWIRERCNYDVGRLFPVLGKIPEVMKLRGEVVGPSCTELVFDPTHMAMGGSPKPGPKKLQQQQPAAASSSAGHHDQLLGDLSARIDTWLDNLLVE